MVVFYLLFAFLAGTMIPFQVGVNARLAHVGGGPIRAALVSVVVGTLALIVLSLIVWRPIRRAASSRPLRGGCGSEGCSAPSTSRARS